MTLVLLTAFSVWVLMLVMEVLPVGGFLLEGTIAVLGGAAIGFFGAWFLRRRSRKNRSDGQPAPSAAPRPRARRAGPGWG